MWEHERLDLMFGIYAVLIFALLLLLYSQWPLYEKGGFEEMLGMDIDREEELTIRTYG
jgi:hypothetical protein